MMKGMKILIICLITVVYALILQAAVEPEGVSAEVSMNRMVVTESYHSNQRQSGDELDELLWIEDWEAGVDNWEFVDANTVEGVYWQPSDWEAFDGDNWRCFDPLIGPNGGYHNHWLQWLITPPLDLTEVEQATLSFQMRMMIELPVNVTVPGYDGWDTANVWASPDNGATWEVIEPTAGPEYSFRSSYAFGYEWGMGEGIPGWGGLFEEWAPVEFDLAPYVGNPEVRVRLAFCSDPAACTDDAQGDPTWTGLQFDDIIIVDEAGDVLFQDDADGNIVGGGLIGFQGLGSIIDPQWQLLEVEDAPSPTHVLGIQDIAPGFHHNYQYAGEIDLSELAEGTIIRLNVWVKGEWSHPTPAPNNPHWTVKVKPADSDLWFFATDPYDRNPANNIVYGDAPEEWTLYSEAYPQPWDLSPYYGQTIQIRVEFDSPIAPYNAGDHYIYFDNFTVEHFGFPHDVGVHEPYIPFPNTVGRLIPATVTFENYGANYESFTAVWYSPTPIPFSPRVELNPGETDTRFLDNNRNDGLNGWMPTTVGDFTMRCRAVLANDNDNANNYSQWVTVTMRPEGVYELGYDNRLPTANTTRFATGEGPLTHFIVPEDLEAFTINTIRVMWGDDFLEDTYDFTIRVFAGGETPGAQLYSRTVTATSDHVAPLWQEINVAGVHQLQGIVGDFWLWFELTDADGFPHIMMSERFVGDEHHFDYDGDNLADSDADWMIRVIGEEGQGINLVTMTLPLRANYFELISTYVVPDDLNAATVFGGVNTLAIVYQDDGSIYLPPIINTIGDIDVTEGYQIFCRAASELTITGLLVDPATEYTLSSGRWNWLGYPFDYQVPVDVALAPIQDHVVIVMNDEGDIWLPPFVNTLGNMTPGEGYFAFVRQTVTFQYNAGGLRLTESPTDLKEMASLPDQPRPTGLPYAVMVYLDDDLRHDVSTIELYDGEYLVGKSLVQDLGDFTPIIAWQGAPEFGIAGFTPGQMITAVALDTHGKIIATLMSDQDCPRFGEGAYATIYMTRESLPLEFTVAPVYPNPFNPAAIVSFAIPHGGAVNLAIYNTLGQELFHDLSVYPAGQHQICLDIEQLGVNLVSGVYFLQLTYKDKTYSQKLLLLK